MSVQGVVGVAQAFDYFFKFFQSIPDLVSMVGNICKERFEIVLIVLANDTFSPFEAAEYRYLWFENTSDCQYITSNRGYFINSRLRQGFENFTQSPKVVQRKKGEEN
jgi:hypothetical protein